MHFYLVEKIGDGTRLNPFRANYEGSYIWGSENNCPNCGLYIIALPVETDLLQPVTDLETACISRGLLISDVEKWFVGD